jgi:hypothetical protein
MAILWLATTVLPKGTTDAVLRNLFPQDDPYAANPVAWARDILGVHLWSKQREVAESVRDNPRTAVKAGHGVGKTFVAAVILLWFLDTHPNSRVITTATKWSQVKKLLWHEVNQLHKGAKNRPQAKDRPIFRGADLLLTELNLPDGRYAIGMSSAKENSESFAGHHAPHILVIYDEASGVHSNIFEVGEGYMTTAGARALLIGNPTRPHGTFYDAFHKERTAYNTITISALDSPTITGEQIPEPAKVALTGLEWVKSRKAAWGADSVIYAVRVLGRFPKTTDDAVIGLGDVEDAQARDVPASPRTDRITIACDVARFGSDETVIGTRIGARVRMNQTYRGKPITATAGRIMAEARKYPAVATTVVVDDDGVGGGVTDILREKLAPLGYTIVGFNAQNTAYQPDDYPNRRSELWFAMADKLPHLDLDPDDQLAADLTAPVYDYDMHGRRKVEQKADTKKRLGRSPDRADMVLLTLVKPIAPPPPDRTAEMQAAQPIMAGILDEPT